LGWFWWGEHGFYAHEVVERGALGVVEGHAAHGGIALVGWEIAEFAEVASNGAALVGWESAELLHGSADLAPLVWRELLHAFVAFEDALPLLRVHGVELRQTLVLALLGLRRKLAEAGFALQCLLLLGWSEIAVLVHPFGEMLTARRACTALALSPTGACTAHGRQRCRSALLALLKCCRTATLCMSHSRA
jgi:hypothetical protein